MSIAIIGLGLMGGSFALALKKTGYNSQLIGVDFNETHCKNALELGLVDAILPLKEAVQKVDAIIVATPVEASITLISEVLDCITAEQFVVDFGSTKGELCASLKQHKNRALYIAAHPIAGTENSGPESAISDLYENKKVVICEKEVSTTKALTKTIELFEKIGMSVVFMSPEEHDKHLAYISHLSHISSFALGLTVLDLEKTEKNIFNLAGSGFSSTARLAKSSPEMWNAIFSQNKEHILPALDSYIQFLQAFKSDILSENKNDLIQKMTKANAIRKIID